MKFCYKFSFILFFTISFFGCNSYIVQDIIGNPTKHLETYDKNFVVKVDYKYDFVYTKLKAYFYANQCDIYKTKKEADTSIIFVRNLSKVFQNLNMTTDLYLNISKIQNSDMTLIKIVSLNYELAEYLNDVVSDILKEEERKDKEIEAKRLAELKEEEIKKLK